jgi:formylglycine-generating enzyme required for sulfatase activity
MRTGDNVPAGVHWNQAQAYCHWLGKLTGLPIDLPTEAQWEFAASNRTNSYWKPFPTASGKLEEGSAHPTFAQAVELLGESLVYPVGRFAPSPAGLYDLLGNGFDWVQDWYAPRYAASSAHNPSGPATGERKVLKGSSSRDDPVAHRYLGRHSALPNGYMRTTNKGTKEPAWYGDQSFRCAVHAPGLTSKP